MFFGQSFLPLPCFFLVLIVHDVWMLKLLGCCGVLCCRFEFGGEPLVVVAAAVAVAVGGVSFCWRLALPLWWVSQVLRCFKFCFFCGLIHIHFCKTCMVV